MLASCDARAGARTRSTSEATSVVTRRTSAEPGCERARIRSWPTAASATRSSIVSTPGGAVEQRALVGRRPGRDREHRSGAVEQHEAGLERARGGAHDIGQPGA